jgi:hypothetical protein
MALEGFGLLVGHLTGDYLVQNDWMAKNKVNPRPGKEGHPSAGTDAEYVESLKAKEQREWWVARDAYRRGHLACTVHCLLYTAAVWAYSWWWMPWWGLLVCFLVHWPTDRFRLARWWMLRVSGQKDFATGPLAPWSVIVVDNTWHLTTLFWIAWFAGRA